MRPLALVLWIVGGGAAACSSLEDVTPNICGNGVLEAGEDCDSNDPRCVQCGIRCEFALAGAADEQCSSFPGAAGFVCGADDFCHAPSGLFRAPTELSTGIDTFRASDVNSDGYGDLIVQSSTAIRVLFGNADGQPTTSTQVLTPIARGAAAYADLDLDAAGKLDVLLPAADGIVAYTSPYDVLSPYPFPSIVSSANEGTPYYSHPIDERAIGFVGSAPGAPAGSPVMYFVRDIDPAGSNMFVAMAPLCGATDETFDPRAVDVFAVRPDYLLVATTFRAGATKRLCVLAVERSGTTFTLTELPVNLAVGRTPTSRPVLAPIGAGPCPSIVIRERVGAQPPGDVVAYAGTGTLTCSYSGAPSTRTLATDQGDPVGWAPLAPADPVSGATIAMAMATGVFAVPPTGALGRQLYIADRPLHALRHADFDGDGDTDLVASSLQLDEPVEDLDVLTRFDVGFHRVRLDTDGPVDQLAIGDFDGNGIADVAYVQTRVIGGANRYELAVTYATGDGLLPGVGAGTYGRIISLLTADIPDSNDPFNVIEDLVVLYQDFEQTAITLLHGSPQRTMLGYFDPNVDEPAVFRGIVAGRFNDAAGPPGLDMIAIDDGENGVPRVWRSNGPTGSEVEMPPPNTVALLADCTQPSVATNLCIDGALYVAWPVDDARDRVLAFGQDANGDVRVITFDPHGAGGTFAAAAWSAFPELPPRSRIRAAEVVRLGGTPMLVLSIFAELEARTLLCEVDSSGAPVACHELGTFVSTPEVAYACTHATAARIRPIRRFMENPSTVEDLIVVCHDKANADATTLFAVTVENAAPVRATELVGRVPRAREVRVGDIDGNGLADVLMVDRESAVPTLRIFRQCTSREASACAR